MAKLVRPKVRIIGTFRCATSSSLIMLIMPQGLVSLESWESLHRKVCPRSQVGMRIIFKQC